MLFIQQGIKGLIAEYDPSMGFGDLEVKLATTPSERNFSGTWALFLAFGLVWTSFKLRQVRQLDFPRSSQRCQPAHAV